MKKNTFNGWDSQGHSVFVFYTGDRIVDVLGELHQAGVECPGPVRWGDESEASRFIAMAILWFCTSDWEMANDLGTLFCHDVVKDLGPRWSLEREWVRDWVQLHQQYRTTTGGYPMRWVKPCLN